MNDSITQQGQLELSLVILQSQGVAFVCWIIVGSINLIFAILTLTVFSSWKPLHTDTQFLAGNLAVSEIGLSTSTVVLAIYHLHNLYNDIPENITKNECFIKTVWQVLFLFLQAMFHVAISCDRFFAAIFPMRYNDRNKNYKFILAAAIWSAATVLTMLLYQDVDKNEMVLICFTRKLYGDAVAKITTGLFVTFSLLSVTIYIICLIILKLQIAKTGMTDGNVAEIGIRMRNKVTQSLAIIAFIHFATYTSGSAGSLLMVSLDKKADYLTSYFALLMNFGGISSFGVYYSRQLQFREGIRFLTKCRQGSGNNNLHERHQEEPKNIYCQLLCCSISNGEDLQNACPV